VQDDIIDATYSSEEAGKPTGNDEHKNSFVNLLGLKGAVAEKMRLLSELDAQLAKLDTRLAGTLKAVIDDYFKG
jgi:farnesyl diphosphate synthase